MKGSYPAISLERFCRLLGVTRQAMYQHGWHTESMTIEAELVIQQVINIRNRHPVLGTRKLYAMLQTFLQEHGIKMGRISSLICWLPINYWYEEEGEESPQPSRIIAFISILTSSQI